MSTQEKEKILEALAEGTLSAEEASERLNVHRTTLWRLRRRWEQKGTAAFVHGLRGRRSNRSKSDTFRQDVCNLFENDYKPKGHSAFSFYQNVARGLPDYVCYTTVLNWLRTS